MFIKNVLILSLVLLANGVTAEIDDDELSAEDMRKLAFTPPVWWKTVQKTYKGNDLKRCFRKRDVAPQDGKKCSRKAKTCFFGTQTCAGDVDLPTTMCYCDGIDGTQKWVCKDAPCPITLAPPGDPLTHPTPLTLPTPGTDPAAVTEPVPLTKPFPVTRPLPVTKPLPVTQPPLSDDQGCPLAGGFETFNDAMCPAKSPIGGLNTCTADQNGLSCSWGQENCCGNCSPSNRCSCNDGQWGCYNTDACMRPQCNDRDWMTEFLKGETCKEATDVILAAFPGMTVTCLKSSDPMPTTDDRERYIIVTDDTTGAITAVILNRNAECPAADVFKNDQSCSVFGQQCTFVADEYSDPDLGLCTITHICTCKFGSFTCVTKSIACVPEVLTLPPPVTKGAPVTVDEQGCPLEGLGFEVLNDPACPAKSPLGGSDPCPADGLKCKYGKESCCGRCSASLSATCDTKYGWFGFHTDACMMPQCFTYNWGTLVGSTCEEAKSAVLAKFSGMEVYCQADTVAMPTEDDFERYIIVTDKNGVVTSVVFNRDAECPVIDEFKALADQSCDVMGQKCTYETDSSSANAICTTDISCTCQFGSFLCAEISQQCVSRNPPSIQICPELEAYQAGTRSCAAPGETCNFKFDASTDDANCVQTDACTCTKDNELFCALSIECVPKTAPSVSPP